MNVTSAAKRSTDGIPTDFSTSITGLGMVTSLGLNAQTSCAAARAGISRAQELDYFTQWSPTDGEISPVKAHQIPQIAEGFEGPARLVRILGAAFTDLRSRHRDISWVSDETAAYLAIADRFRIWHGAELVADAEIRERFLTAQQEIPEDNTEFDDAHRIYELALKSAGVSVVPQLRMVSRADNCAMAICINQAISDLSSGMVQTAIIAGVDSLLEESTLEWLSFTGRLKSAAIPRGLAPGEAGVVLLLQPSASTPTPLASCKSTHKAREENSLFSGKPVLGHALAELIESTTRPGRRSGWFVTDQNGEDYRAMEWGQALLRTELSSVVLSYPAISFGDTGAASVGVAIAQIVHAFRRNYAPSDTGIVLSGTASSERTGLVIER